MFSVFRSVCGPAAVTHAVVCRFSNPLEDDLLLVRGHSVLQVWRIFPDPYRLFLFAEWKLYGSIVSLEPLSINNMHAIVVSFERAKAVILRYSFHSLHSISLHCFEKDTDLSLPSTMATALTQPPLIRVDHVYKCFAMSIFLDRLAVVPFKANEIESLFTVDPSYVICLRDLDLANIRDFSFVQGYLDTTVAVLFASQAPYPIQPPSLSAPVVHPSGYSMPRCAFVSPRPSDSSILFCSNSMPHSSHSLLPCAFGGVLVIATNAIVYVSQSFPDGIFALVNDYHKHDITTNSKKIFDHCRLGLSIEPCDKVFFIDPLKLALLRSFNSEMWIIDITTNAPLDSIDSLGSLGFSITGFHFTKCSSLIPMASCAANFDSYFSLFGQLDANLKKEPSNLIFIGSSNGSSLLLKWDKFNQPSKTSTCAPLLKVGDASLQFTVVDAIEKLGCLKDAVFGRVDKQDSLFCVGGFENASSHGIYHQSINPIVVERFEMNGARGVWTIDDDKPLIVLSNDQKTIVFDASNGLKQITFNFDSHSKSLYMFNIKGMVVQITLTEIILFSVKKGYRNAIPTNGVVECAACCRGYLGITLSNGNLKIYKLSKTSSGYVLVLIYSRQDVQWLDLFDDRYGAFAPSDHIAREKSVVEQFIQKKQEYSAALASKFKTAAKLVSTPAKMNASDDFDFYEEDTNESESNEVFTNNAFSSGISPLNIDLPVLAKIKRKSAILCCILSKSTDSLEIINIETLEQIYLVNGVSRLESTIFDAQNFMCIDGNVPVVQVHLMSFGSRFEDINMVFVLKTGVLAVYKVLQGFDQNIDASSCRSPVFLSKRTLDASILLPQIESHSIKTRVYSFKNIANHAGAFIFRGRQPPIWLLASSSGHLNAYTMASLDSMVSSKNSKEALYITGFAPYSSSKCPNGFLMAMSNGYIVLSRLQSGIMYEYGMPFRKENRLGNPQMCCYHKDSETFAVVTSKPVDFELAIEVPDQQEHNAPTALKVNPITPEHLAKRPRKTGAYKPQTRRYTVELISGLNLRKADDFEFEPYESITALSVASLDCKQSKSGKRSYVVVGTSFSKGEDVATRGRIHVFDVVSIVPEVNRPETAHKLKRIAIDDVKAPVGALIPFHGHLLAGTGPKVVVYDLEDGERLVGIAFHDAGVYVSKLFAARAFVTVGDFCKSVMMLAWQEDPPRLQLLGRDHNSLGIVCLSTLVSGSSAAILTGDDSFGLNVLAYSPYSIHSFGGTKLIQWGEFFLGENASQILPFHLKVPRSSLVLSAPSVGALVTTRDCRVCFVVPVSEVLFRRLLLLYNQLAQNTVQNASLHPRSFRAKLGLERLYSSSQTAFVDLDLINEMFSLSVAEQNLHVTAAGTTLDAIHADIKALHNAWSVY